MYLRVTYSDGSESVIPIAAGKVLQVYDSATAGVEVAVPTTGIEYIAVEDGELKVDEAGTWTLTGKADPVAGSDAEGPVVTGPEAQASREELLEQAAALGVEVAENVGDDELKAKSAEAEAEKQRKDELYAQAAELGVSVEPEATADEIEAVIAEAEASAKA